MYSKSLVLFALSATAVIASPFHKRDWHHHRHGTSAFTLRASNTAAAFQDDNSTETYASTETLSAMQISQFATHTVSPLPQSTGADEVIDTSGSSTCIETSLSTQTSITLVTVTASTGDNAATLVVTGSVSAGAFYGGSRTWSHGGYGDKSTAPAVSAPALSVPAPSVPAFSASSAATTFVSMPSAAKSSAVASSSAISSPPSGSSGGKRGISFNDASLVAAFGNSVSWSYNWGASESGSLGGVEFVPMMWGQNDVSNFASNVGSATHVLSFNEPDLDTQSNIDPATAAKLHIQAMKSLVGKVKIGSPAVTNGAGTSPVMGVDWLDQFFTACGGDCPVDFVAYHWYAGADSIAYFKSHTQDIINVAAKYGVSKVWLTEFQPTSGDDSAQASFMQEAVAFLDATPAVERYAAFMASDSTLLSGGSLNTIGAAYAGAS